MIITQERRLDPRVRVQVRFELNGAEGTGSRHLQTQNLSAAGARCVGGAWLEVGTEVTGRLVLPVSGGGRDREVELVVRARIVHAEKRGPASASGARNEYGLRFVELSEAATAELRSFLLDSMAEDSGGRGAGREDW